MPFSYRISEEEGVAYVTASGPVDVRSSVETMGELSRDPIFDPDFKVVVDLREMQYRPSLGELRVIAWALGHEKTSFRNKVAVVVSESVRRRRAKVYSKFGRMAGFALELFPDMDDALAWVRTPSPKAEGI
jgi:hypothetical protein